MAVMYDDARVLGSLVVTRGSRTKEIDADADADARRSHAGSSDSDWMSIRILALNKISKSFYWTHRPRMAGCRRMRERGQ
jgi:hypothetical protein